MQENAALKHDAKTLVKQHCMILWQDYNNGSSKGSHCKTLQPSVWQSLPVGSNRSENSVLFQVRSGHCRLNNNLYKTGVKDSPDCTLCHIPETVEHLLISRPQYSKQRSALEDGARRSNISSTLQNELTKPEIITQTVILTGECGRQV